MELNLHLERASHLINTRRYTDAMKELNMALALVPQNPRALALMAACHYDTGEYDRSMAFTRSWLSVEPDNDRAHYLMAINYAQLDKKENAKQSIQQALAYDPLDADYWSFLASLHLQEKEWNKVLEYAEKGLENDGSHAESLNYRNLALTKLGRADELRVGIEESLKANPDDAHTHATIGWAKLETRKYKEARFHFAEALRLEPHNNWARNGMIEALKAKNILYRFFLLYFFWMAKHKAQAQWGIIVGIYIGTRILRVAARYNPILYIPFGILVFASYLTWILDPLFNVFVLLDRYGRYLLNEREKTGAILVGGGVALAIGCGVGVLALNNQALLWPAIYFATIVIPVASFFGLDENERGLKTIGIYTVALSIAGVAAVMLLLTENSAGTAIGLLYMLAIWSFGWVANYFNTR